ncbi:MAG TPA: peptidylprolyl isomerase [Candidatus Tumulicola sp.]|jgi:foldase protein PrsA
MSKAQRLIAGIVSLVLAAGLTACASGGSVATVNGEPISNAAFQDKLEASPGARNTLQQMVQETLIMQYAKSNNITVSDQEISDRENDLKANFPNGSWDEMLKARGLSEDDVKQALREQIILDKALAKQVTVTPAQIKAYYDKNTTAYDKPETVQARHILVANLDTANKVEAALKGGQDFAAVAKQYSIDPGSKDKGGDLGTFRRGQMVPAFDKVAFSQAVNVISPPVKSQFGYHIIQVEARTPATKATLASATPRIEETLRQQQEAPLIQPFLQNLQTKATITVNDPRFADLFPASAPAAAASAGASAAPAGSPAASASPMSSM